MAGELVIARPGSSIEQGVTVVEFTTAVTDPVAVEAGCTPTFIRTQGVSAGIQYWMEPMGVGYGLLLADGTFTVQAGSAELVRPIDALTGIASTGELGADAGFMVGGTLTDNPSALICWR